MTRNEERRALQPVAARTLSQELARLRGRKGHVVLIAAQAHGHLAQMEAAAPGAATTFSGQAMVAHQAEHGQSQMG